MWKKRILERGNSTAAVAVGVASRMLREKREKESLLLENEASSLLKRKLLLAKRRGTKLKKRSNSSGDKETAQKCEMPTLSQLGEIEKNHPWPVFVVTIQGF